MEGEHFLLLQSRVVMMFQQCSSNLAAVDFLLPVRNPPARIEGWVDSVPHVTIVLHHLPEKLMILNDISHA